MNEEKRCASCAEIFPLTFFRRNRHDCSWCQFASMELRAKHRYKDKSRVGRLEIDMQTFVAWYVSQPDQCHYCGTSREEFKQLRIRHFRGGAYVSWDIDRMDSSLPYRPGNLALSCFMCNTAKGNHFSEVEMRVIGRSIRLVMEQRLQAAASPAMAVLHECSTQP